MRTHPREAIVSEAQVELTKLVLGWSAKHDLSDGELLSVLDEVLGDRIAGLARRIIRDERHPHDPEKPGGIE